MDAVHLIEFRLAISLKFQQHLEPSYEQVNKLTFR